MSTNKIRVSSLAHVHYQHPDLNQALSFFHDFGMIEEQRLDGKVYLRGYGTQPYIYVAEQSPDGKRHFMGGYWNVESAEDLQRAASHPNASTIQESHAPGGGQHVTIEDINGFIIGFVFGQKLRDDEKKPLSLERADSGQVSNTAVGKPRKGAFRRFEPGPSPVHRLGHYGFMVPKGRYEETLQWYLDLINLKPSDVVFNPETGKDETCFNHIDLGAEYTDHHSFFVAELPEDKPAHVHHCSFEVNDFDTQTLGHDWLRSKNWTNCWGIGRHVLGSQIFDYWFDASGNVVEHYSDGDLVNEDTPCSRAAAAPNTLFIWGPNIPLAFITGQMSDAKAAMMPPSIAEPVAT